MPKAKASESHSKPQKNSSLTRYFHNVNPFLRRGYQEMRLRQRDGDAFNGLSRSHEGDGLAVDRI